MDQTVRHSVMPDDAAARRRVVGAIVFAAVAMVFAFGAWLTPDVAGHGTHEQLGLPPCSMKMFTGKPCPTCGYTTAFSHVAHGQLGRAMTVQPAATLLAGAVVFAGAVGAFVMITGRDVADRFRPLWRARTLVIVGLIVAAGWLYKWIVAG